MFEVQNLRSGELLNRTLNPWSGPGSDLVLEVQEPDHSQSMQGDRTADEHVQDFERQLLKLDMKAFP